MKKLVALPAGLVILAAGLLGSAGTASAATPTHLGSGAVVVSTHPGPEHHYRYSHHHYIHHPAAVHHYRVYHHRHLTRHVTHMHYVQR